MESKTSPEKPAESRAPASEEEEQFAQIAAVFRQNLERNTVTRQLFALVPELESIQKDIRQKVPVALYFVL